MSEQIKILLVEDDLNLGFLLLEHLEESGFYVKLYRDGESAYNAFLNNDFDFCLLDVMLPKMDGFSLAEKIKKKEKLMPIAMLTARSMDEDKIKGFKLGIDDYITKPFNEEELVLRIKAILARVNSGATHHSVSKFDIGTFSFDSKNQQLTHKESEETRRLTKKENDILKMLCLSTNQVVSRTEIMRAVWGDDDYFIGRSLDVFISKLRKYLQSDSSITIDSIPSVGLILNITS